MTLPDLALRRNAQHATAESLFFGFVGLPNNQGHNIERCPWPPDASNWITDAFPWEQAPQYLTRDRDAFYGARNSTCDNAQLAPISSRP
jgi:hypothetical protein